MSEHPIIKHTMKAYRVMKAHDITLGKRIAEICIEIAIIIFAITLSIALERWRDFNRKRDIEKQFYKEYKKDLLSDINELAQDSATCYRMSIAFNYFLHNNSYKKDSIKNYYGYLFNTTDFIPNSSRIEALKASGNIDVIRNKKLLDDILSYYAETIPNLTGNTGLLSKLKTEYLTPYLYAHMKYNMTNIEEVLQSDVVKNYLGTKRIAIFLMAQYHRVIAEANHIMGEIDQEERR